MWPSGNDAKTQYGSLLIASMPDLDPSPPVEPTSIPPRCGLANLRAFQPIDTAVQPLLLRGGGHHPMKPAKRSRADVGRVFQSSQSVEDRQGSGSPMHMT